MSELENTGITPDELFHWDPSTYLILDVREREDFEKDSIPGSLHYDLDAILGGSAALPKNAGDYRLVVVCRYGRLSENAAEALRARGLDAYNLEGGYGRFVYESAMRAEADEERRKEIEKSIRGKFKKDLYGKFCHAIVEYELVKPGDKIAVCISGGKDSMLLAKILQELQRHGNVPFELVYLTMNPGYNEENWSIVQSNAKILGIPLTVFESGIFDAVKEIDKNPCYLCARMRRGNLYANARDLGCNKIALGHHFDDVIETVLMGMLFAGKFETMMPKLHSRNFPGMELIRPLYLVREADVKAWRDYNHLHFIQCACRFTEDCADNHGTSRRSDMKELIARLQKVDPTIPQNIFNSTRDVSLNTILGWHTREKAYYFLDDYEERG